MKEFILAIENNPELKEKLEALFEKPMVTDEDFCALAAEYGFNITVGELEEQAAEMNTELTDEELQKVSGGLILPSFVTIIKGLDTGAAGLKCLTEGRVIPTGVSCQHAMGPDRRSPIAPVAKL